MTVSKITLWTYDDWTGTTPGIDGVFQIKPETRLRPKSNKLTFWVEGIDETTVNGMDIVLSALNREDGKLFSDDKSHILVTDLNFGVDGNRDGVIEFDNSYDQQLTFWLNNDQEGRLKGPESEEIDVLDSGITKPDNTDNKIDGTDDEYLATRDLEDFAAINFKVSPTLRYFTTFTSTKIEFEGELRNDANSSLHFFKSASPVDDPLAHVENSTTAAAQIADQNTEKFRIGRSSPHIDLDFAGQTNGVLRYLFEAWGNILRGDETASLKPTLVFRVKVTYPGGNIVTREREIKLDLRDITAFYTRREIPYMVNGIDIRTQLNFTNFGNSIETGRSQVLQAPFLSGDDTYVMLHGWEMAPEWKAVFAKTAVKRLYWEGYRGEIVAFDWPTFNNAEVPKISIFPESMASTYNASEFQALRSGRALMNFLSTRRPDKTHLIAHSMGNIVAAEALRQWSRVSPNPLVKNYVAMEGAISAGAYGATVSGGVPSAMDVSLPISYGGYDLSSLGDYQISGPLPDLYSNFQGSPYMAGTTGAAGTWINFFNTQDSATNQSWRANNLLKVINNRHTPGAYVPVYVAPTPAPPVRTFVPSYGLLLPSPDFWSSRYVTQLDQQGFHFLKRPYPNLDLSNFGDPTSAVTTDIGMSYETLAFMSVSTVATIGNSIMPGWTNIDLSLIVRPTGVTLDLFSTHSFQFYHDAAKTSVLWRRLITSTGAKSSR